MLLRQNFCSLCVETGRGRHLSRNMAVSICDVKCLMMQTVSFCLIALDEIMTAAHHNYYCSLLYRKKTYFTQS